MVGHHREHPVLFRLALILLDDPQGNVQQADIRIDIGFVSLGDDPHIPVAHLEIVCRQLFRVDVSQAGKTTEDKHIPHEIQSLRNQLLIHYCCQLLVGKVTPVDALHLDLIGGEGVGAHPAIVEAYVEHRAEVLHEVDRRVVGRRMLSAVPKIETFDEVVVDFGKEDIVDLALPFHVLGQPIAGQHVALVGALGNGPGIPKLAVLHDKLVANVQQLLAMVVEAQDRLFDLADSNRVAQQDDLVVASFYERPVVVQHSVDLLLLPQAAYSPALDTIPAVGQDVEFGGEVGHLSVDGDPSQDGGLDRSHRLPASAAYRPSRSPIPPRSS